MAFALLIAMLGTTACSRSGEDVVIAPPSDPALSGRFFASAGEGESKADLYEMRFNPFRLYRLSDTGRVFGIGGCATDLVVTIADKSVGFRDELRSYDGDAFRPIAGLGDPSGALPASAADCRLLFSRLDNTKNPAIDRIMVFDPRAQTTTELKASSGDTALGIPAWGPNGEVAVYEGTAPATGVPSKVTGIVVISPDGSSRTIEPPVASFGGLAWAPSQWMAFADLEQDRTVFLHPGTGERSELAGWVPLSWSPDGMRLLVTDAKESKTIGLVALPDLQSVRKVGAASKAAVFNVVWLPDDATAGGPMTVGRRPDDGGES
ncbi:MAG: hypothetical protein ACRDZ3_01140 [Acidimicrobiia bacterium]